jgi:hypothetical protein
MLGANSVERPAGPAASQLGSVPGVQQMRCTPPPTAAITTNHHHCRPWVFEPPPPGARCGFRHHPCASLHRLFLLEFSFLRCSLGAILLYYLWVARPRVAGEALPNAAFFSPRAHCPAATPHLAVSHSSHVKWSYKETGVKILVVHSSLIYILFGCMQYYVTRSLMWWDSAVPLPMKHQKKGKKKQKTPPK